MTTKHKTLEDAILDVLAQEQEHVSNEELRHYMNENNLVRC